MLKNDLKLGTVMVCVVSRKVCYDLPCLTASSTHINIDLTQLPIHTSSKQQQNPVKFDVIMEVKLIS